MRPLITLLVLYTNECVCVITRVSSSLSLQIVDDSVILSLISDGGTDHGPVVGDFSEWFKLFSDKNMPKMSFRLFFPPALIHSQAVSRPQDELFLFYFFLMCSVLCFLFYFGYLPLSVVPGGPFPALSLCVSPPVSISVCLPFPSVFLLPTPFLLC